MRVLAIVPLLALFACDDTTDQTDTDTTTTDTTTDSSEPTVVSCTDGVEEVTGEILENTTWSSACTYLLRAGVFVGGTEVVAESERVTLTIEPGTLIVGESETNGFLSINRGGRIIADGTATRPIVMTSSQDVGARNRGDWGGLILNGNATVSCDRAYFDIGDFCEGEGEGGTGLYGGTDDEDSSGSLSYLRVEFAGTLESPEIEFNGISLQGVGSGTNIDFVHVHKVADDGIEIFGGTANLKHVVVSQVGDDMLDWTDGWTGNAQFIVLQAATDAAGNHGIEADSNAENNEFIPRSDPTLSNMTVIGSPSNKASDIGLLLREGTTATILNSQIIGFEEACFDMDGQSTFRHGIVNADTSMKYVLMDCATNFAGDKSDPLDAAGLEAWFLDQVGNILGNTDLDPESNELNPTAPLFTSAISGGSVPNDPFFEGTAMIGAVSTTDDWTDGWTNFPPN